MTAMAAVDSMKSAVYRRPVLFLAAIAIVALAAMALANAVQVRGGPNRDAWGQVQATGVLRIGIDASYPPFASLDSAGHIVGLDADLARELGSAVQAKRVDLINMSYDGLYDALRIGQVDALVSALVVDPHQANVLYSISYFDAGQVLVIPAVATKPVTLEDLGGMRLAVELGSDGDVLARQQAPRLGGLQILAFPSSEEALSAVGASHADAALVDSVSARTYIAHHPELHLAGPPVEHEIYAVVVRRTSSALLKAINGQIIHMRDDGELDKLIARWMGG